MSIRSFSIVLLALIFGGSLAFGINKFLKQGQATAAPADLVPVLIAAEDIGVYCTITEDMVKENIIRIEQLPKERVPLGSVESIEEAAGRLTLFSVNKGEYLSIAKLSSRGPGGIGAAIPKGMRLFTILTPNLTTSVGGFIRQGSKVDVHLTVKHLGAEEPPTTLQNLEVFAVDQRVDAQPGSKIDAKEIRSLTLKVTPQQAEKMFRAQNSGAIQLSLRNPNDGTEITKTEAEPARETVSVVIAAKDIAAGAGLTNDLVRIEQHPKERVPLGSLRSLEEAAGQLTLFPLAEGEPISTAKLSGKASLPRTPALIQTIRGVQSNYLELADSPGIRK